MKWQIRLEIKTSEFKKLCNLLNSNNKWSLTEENGSYYLSCSDFESLTSVADVYGPATKLLQDISAIAMIRIQGFPPLKADVIAQVDEHGKRKHWFSLSADLYCDNSDVDLELEGGQDFIPDFKPEPWLTLKEQDDIVKNVFRIWYSFEHNWINLYKIYEIVNKDAGENIKTWVTEKKIKNFKHTSQSVSAIGDDARHGTEKSSPPPNPMSLSEAQVLIMTLLENWLNWKLQKLSATLN